MLLQVVYYANIISYIQLSREVACKTLTLTHISTYTVNIYRYKTIEGNGTTSVIPTTSKSFSLYLEIPNVSLGNLPKNGNLPIEAKKIPYIG